jgi:hypothetical protein
VAPIVLRESLLGSPGLFTPKARVMARNRMIKVDFWADEKIGRMSIMARLMFIGIWNFCDDSGICRASPAYIRSNIFQHDDLTLSQIGECIGEMQKQRLITLAEYSGESFLRVNNFMRHQTINRPSTFRFISESDSMVSELFDSVSTHDILTDDSLTKVKEKVKVKGKEKVKVNGTSSEHSVSVREAYIKSYEQRYGIKPIIAAKENSLIKRLIASVGLQDAIRIVLQYPSYQDPWHVKQKHPLGLLIAQLDKVRVELNDPRKMLDAGMAHKELRREENKMDIYNAFSKHIGGANV